MQIVCDQRDVLDVARCRPVLRLERAARRALGKGEAEQFGAIVPQRFLDAEAADIAQAVEHYDGRVGWHGTSSLYGRASRGAAGRRRRLVTAGIGA
jgi:hypothetical protein